jgi:hypothetical protein
VASQISVGASGVGSKAMSGSAHSHPEHLPLTITELSVFGNVHDDVDTIIRLIIDNFVDVTSISHRSRYTVCVY